MKSILVHCWFSLKTLKTNYFFCIWKLKVFWNPCTYCSAVASSPSRLLSWPSRRGLACLVVKHDGRYWLMASFLVHLLSADMCLTYCNRSRTQLSPADDSHMTYDLDLVFANLIFSKFESKQWVNQNRLKISEPLLKIACLRRVRQRKDLYFISYPIFKNRQKKNRDILRI
jgi:hypothetical protein